jgi:murein DD-endopeptidase MepM/ murein hydrolase activator NlpD
MKYWPVPNSYSKNIPAAGSPGSFWEDRGDRRHCGIDIYAPEGSDVIAVENGKVIDIGPFTSSLWIPYWNTTYYILIKNTTGYICKYAELQDVNVHVDEQVNSGQLIGHVGQVLNSQSITQESPAYIKKLQRKKKLSMLHVELLKAPPIDSKEYLGGNWYGSKKPRHLVNPMSYLLSIIRSSSQQSNLE